MSNKNLGSEIVYFDTFFKRFMGLMFKTNISINTSFVIKNCSSIHTCFMKFPIDVFGLDENFKVIEMKNNIKPWRVIFFAKSVKHVVESKYFYGNVTIKFGEILELEGK